MNHVRPSRRGFVILFILAMLGVLAFLAVQFSMRAKTMSHLGDDAVIKARLTLMTKSGLEVGRRLLNKGLESGLRDGDDKIVAFDGRVDSDYRAHLTVETGAKGFKSKGEISAVVMDSNGAINVNDGLAAGRLEDERYGIPGGYKANQVDPWPGGSEDISGLINLRLRRLLNAYGDVWKFRADLGSLPDVGDDKGTWQQPFEFSSSAAGDRGTSMPAKTGLGDVIIASRPQNGYGNVNQLREIINNWGATTLTGVNPAFLNGVGGFWELVSYDMTLASYEDSSFSRITREFGPYQNDPTSQSVPTETMDENIPNLDALWRSHPVSLINLNSASREVLAATFYAPTNVSYSCEDSLAEGFMMKSTGYSPWINTNHSLGVSGPLFPLGRILENGYPTTAVADISELESKYADNVQKNRLMSLRDALLLSNMYEQYAQTNADGAPTDFVGFAACLQEIRSGTFAPGGDVFPGYERALASSTTKFPKIATSNGADYWFDQTYVERTLPHMLSGMRRIPSWLGAPIALTSPYLHPKVSSEPLNSPNYFPLRSVEDFVRKCHLPKVDFLPCGQFIVHVGAAIEEGERYESELKVIVKSYETRIFRSQADFERLMNSGETGDDMVTAPEVASVEPHGVLGAIGMKDRVEPSYYDRPVSTRLEFEVDNDTPFTSMAGSEWNPLQLETASWANDSLSLVYPYSNSDGATRTYDFKTFGKGAMESGESLFMADADAGDVSAFGGTLFSARGHGPHAADPFQDSLIFDPMSVCEGDPGTTFNKGLVSFWFRVPTGLRYGHHVLFSLNTFQKSEMSTDMYSGDAQQVELDEEMIMALMSGNWELIYKRIYLTQEPAVPAEYADRMIEYLLSTPLDEVIANGSEYFKYEPLQDKADVDTYVRPISMVVYYDAATRSIYAVHETGPVQTTKTELHHDFVTSYNGSLKTYSYEANQYDPNSDDLQGLGVIPEPPEPQGKEYWYELDQMYKDGDWKDLDADALKAMLEEMGLDYDYDKLKEMLLEVDKVAGPTPKVTLETDEFTADRYRPDADKVPTDEYKEFPYAEEMSNRPVDFLQALKEAYDPRFQRKRLVRVIKANLPGSWHQLTLGWNNSKVFRGDTERFWMFDHNGYQSTAASSSGVPSILTHNPKMSMAVGELPIYFKDTMHRVNTHTSVGDVDKNQFVPICRANTLIDDLDFRFGMTSSKTDETGDGGDKKDDSDKTDDSKKIEDVKKVSEYDFNKDTLMSWPFFAPKPWVAEEIEGEEVEPKPGPGPEPVPGGDTDPFFGLGSSKVTQVKASMAPYNLARRYDVGSSAVAALDPSRVDPLWRPGSRVIAVGARIFDPPEHSSVYEITKSPSATLLLENPWGTDVTPAYVPALIKGHLFQQEVATNSASSVNSHTYQLETLKANSRISLTWRSQTASGGTLGRVTNIPWVTEVNYRIKGPSESILRWIED